MSGFPLRISRDTLGPVLHDDYPVVNPETQIPAAAFNTAFHQLAGMNGAMPTRAVAIVEYTGGVLTTHYQAEAWNPNGGQVHPVIARTGTGVYTVTFAATYLNELSVAVPISLMFAKATPQVAVAAYASRCFAYASVSGLVVTVTTWNSSGSAADCKFMVEIG